MIQKDIKKHIEYEYIIIFFISILIPSYVAVTSGISWDEPYYIIAGCKYAKWFFGLSFTSFNYETILDFWKIGHEHPPLAKIGFGIFNLLFGDYLGFIFSSRLFNIILYAFLNISLYAFFKKKYSSYSAWTFFFILLTLEKYISYSVIATLDFPLTFFWSLTVLFFYLGFSKKKFFVFSCILFSLAFLIKFNAIFLIIPIFIWGIIYKKSFLLSKIVIMLAISILLFFLFWPWLWHNSSFRFFEYIKNKTGRVGIIDTFNIENKVDKFINKVPSKVPVHYLGRNYKDNSVPFHYAFVMFNSTVPFLYLLLFYYSVFIIIKNYRTEDFGLLCILNAFISILIFSLPFMPKYGGIRFILGTYPFFAMTISIGLKYLIQNNKRKKIILFILIIIFNNILFGLIKHRNYLNAYYNFLIPNKTTMHIDNAGTLLKKSDIAYLNEIMPENSKLSIIGTDDYVIDLYFALNYFRKDIILQKDFNEADYLVIIPNRETFTEEISNIYIGNNTTFKQFYSNKYCNFYQKTIIQ